MRCDASFVLLQAPDEVKAIRLRANRLGVRKKGETLASTPEAVSSLTVGGERLRFAFCTDERWKPIAAFRDFAV